MCTQTNWHMWHLRGILVFGIYVAITCCVSNNDYDDDGAINDSIAFCIMR